jgi:shikimate dehydrogenase
MTKLAGLIGFPVVHSVSPALQQAAFDYHGLDARYEYWETQPEDLASRIASIRDSEVIGAQVTVPHKQAALEFVDTVTDDVRALGACNVLSNKGGSLAAFNTDVTGFVRALKEDAGADPKDKRVLLLGAGGAARAIVLGLAREGIASLVIANRTVAKATEVGRVASGLVSEIGAVPFEGKAVAEAAAGADLIVNSTTLGMSGVDGSVPLMAAAIPPTALVYDIVYNPPDTPLLLEARKAGAQTLGGLAMLVYVGAESFEQWTGLKAPVAVMMAAAQKALAEKTRG